jgi:hypothetical protein
MRAAIIENVIRDLNDAYVFPDVSRRIEQSLHARLKNHEYEKVSDPVAFADLLTTHLREVNGDRHLKVEYSPDPIPIRDKPEEPTVAEIQQEREQARRINFGFARVERLGGSNVGYLRVDEFDVLQFGADTLAAAMDFLANTDALIVDLRYNEGGEADMVNLFVSHFFGAQPVHFGDRYSRLDNTTEHNMTLSYVPGKRYLEKDVYVLTSKLTASGAEAAAYTLKNQKRATVIGETTRGAARPGLYYRINEHFQVLIPVARNIDVVTKTDWEGTGVKPNIEVSAELALPTAQLIALRKLAEKNTDTKLARSYRSKIELAEITLDNLIRETKTVVSEPQTMAGFTGRYELPSGLIFTVTSAGTKLFGQLGEDPKFELAARSESRFYADAYLAFITFLRNESGQVSGLIFNLYGQDSLGKRR